MLPFCDPHHKSGTIRHDTILNDDNSLRMVSCQDSYFNPSPAEAIYNSFDFGLKDLDFKSVGSKLLTIVVIDSMITSGIDDLTCCRSSARMVVT
ncbi:hypothetical protein EVAR_22103_1 [Eumeta japonica]|uniref:Uncharacterized protein n=1 Tax=Eumeta variegata TaxID=151549 RepID=A0A4C1W142_EUMVA|nr:hypothetical protein EVAR_22103_1 [Eumeta japonica]